MLKNITLSYLITVFEKLADIGGVVVWILLIFEWISTYNLKYTPSLMLMFYGVVMVGIGLLHYFNEK